jgi:ATP-dependent DNA helicase RecG
VVRLPVHPLAEVPVAMPAEQASEQITPEVLGMLAVIQGDMSRSEIMVALGLKDEKHFREHYQQTGIASGVISMTLPDKPRSSKQRYRLTALGERCRLQARREGERK